MLSFPGSPRRTPPHRGRNSELPSSLPVLSLCAVIIREGNWGLMHNACERPWFPFPGDSAAAYSSPSSSHWCGRARSLPRSISPLIDSLCHQAGGKRKPRRLEANNAERCGGCGGEEKSFTNSHHSRLPSSVPAHFSWAKHLRAKRESLLSPCCFSCWWWWGGRQPDSSTS